MDKLIEIARSLIAGILVITQVPAFLPATTQYHLGDFLTNNDALTTYTHHVFSQLTLDEQASQLIIVAYGRGYEYDYAFNSITQKKPQVYCYWNMIVK